MSRPTLVEATARSSLTMIDELRCLTIARFPVRGDWALRRRALMLFLFSFFPFMIPHVHAAGALKRQ
jgi:hypothetical protein